MKIEQIDSNFATEKVTIKDGMKFYDVPSAPFTLYGVKYYESEKRFARMPHSIAEKVSEGVEHLSKHVSGGRLKFSTDSEEFYISAKWQALNKMAHMPLSGSSGFTLLEETENGFDYVTTFIPAFTDEKGFEGSAHLTGGKMKNYILYFPLYNELSELKIGLNENARVGGGREYSQNLPILFYGSSITQGACASRPDNCYQAYLSKRNDADYICLGFSGNAKGEKIMAEYLADIKCSVFVCDYDHNAPNAEHLEKTLYPLYKTFRAKNPDTPFIFVSKPDFDTDINSKARLKIIRAAYKKALKEGDKKVRFVNGKRLFGIRDRENCFVDGCHPNDLGFYRMAEAINKPVKEFLKG